MASVEHTNDLAPVGIAEASARTPSPRDHTGWTQYKHSPLHAESNIRLFHINGCSPSHAEHDVRFFYPGNGDLHDPVSGSFEEVKLDSSRVYYALSYTWGSEPATQPVRVQDSEMRVSPNLYDALKKLRAGGYTPVWIDGLCIAQEDDDERASQVMLMQDIYGTAKLVVIDLGDNSGHDFGQMLWKLASFSENYKRSDDSLVTYNFDERDNHSQHLLKYGLPEEGDPSWGTMRSFLESPWFTRTWVLQEAVLAKDLVVYWGMNRIERTIFFHFLIMVMSFNLSRFMPASVEAPKNVGTLTRTIGRGYLIQDYWVAWHVPGLEYKEKPSLLQLAINNRGAHCSDPRDHISALLGLTCSTALSDLRPNYKETVCQTYMRAARYFVKCGEAVGLLHRAITPQRIRNLPSWVPEWDAPQGDYDQVLSGLRFHQHVSKVFRTGGTGSSTMRVEEGGYTLFIKGLLFDTVSVLGPASRIGDKTGRTDLMIEVEELGALLRTLNQGYPGDEDIADVWWRACVCDLHYSQDRKAPAEYSKLFNLSRLFHHSEAASNDLDLGTHNDLLMQVLSDLPDSHLSMTHEGAETLYTRLYTSTTEYRAACLEYLLRSRNCLTSKGYICRAPRGVEEGDFVAVFEGVEVPFLLRPVGRDQYRLMGNCYCHGIMYGEALDMPDLEVCDIEIV
ncbi:hypothetical protein LTS07_004720 [Exophiala sideris]|uniref:Heterokaryon incompatibility domain-containing protein n=1 Tax=Exophiala sideris TaxID=1016849 RepID=A0ABR0JCG7_9EURO|nr:hypothetical protein LTS07_004720 [Exophiala sideris]KAK5041025.1 hypothetical protein LTR13_003327 [Exophiala sideris]KAK5061641.1 hypothetical protein LTR69_004823 [Exophiala sideris]KAK5184340.1 hypothetical protein LTR44_003013 [Eurotiomycetes sp. CCFEE 6388]